jgi:hypothetical protein
MMLGHDCSPAQPESLAASGDTLNEVFMEPLLIEEPSSSLEPVEFNFEFSDNNYRFVRFCVRRRARACVCVCGGGRYEDVMTSCPNTEPHLLVSKSSLNLSLNSASTYMDKFCIHFFFNFITLKLCIF